MFPVLLMCVLSERLCVCRAKSAHLCENTAKCRGFEKNEIVSFGDLQERIAGSTDRELELAVFGTTKLEKLSLNFSTALFWSVSVRGLRKVEFVEIVPPPAHCSVSLERIEAVSTFEEWSIAGSKLQDSHLVTTAGKNVRILTAEVSENFYQGIKVLSIGAKILIDTATQKGIEVSTTAISTDSSSITIVGSANLQRALILNVASDTLDIVVNTDSALFMNLLTINATGKVSVTCSGGGDIPAFRVLSSGTTYHFDLQKYAAKQIFVTIEKSRVHVFSGDVNIARRLELVETDTVVIRIASPYVSITFSGLAVVPYNVILNLTANEDIHCIISDYSEMQQGERHVSIMNKAKMKISRDANSHVILEDIIQFTNSGSIVYDPIYDLKFCLCPNTRLKECKEELSCHLFNVPEENYYASRSTEFFAAISASTINLINIYMTSFSESEQDTYHKIDFQAITGQSKLMNFVSVDPNSDTKTKFYFPEDGSDVDLNLTVTGVSFLKIMNYGNSLAIPLLQLSGTLLHIDDNEIVVLNELVSDMYSLATIDGRLQIAGSLTLVGSAVHSIDGVYMKNGSTLIIDRIGAIPEVHVEQKAILFTDGDDDIVITYPTDGNCSVIIREMTPLNPSINIYGLSPQVSESSVEGLSEIVLSMENSLNVTIHNEGGTELMLSVLTFPERETSILSLNIAESDTNVSLFENICGNIDLHIEPFRTFAYIAKHIINKDLVISDIKGLSINFEEVAKEIIFEEGAMTIKSTDDQSVDFEYEDFEKDKFEIRTRQSHTFIDLKSKDLSLEHVPRISFVLDEPGELAFGQNFVETAAASGTLVVGHDSRKVVLSAEAPVVPVLEIDHPISGVQYQAKTEKFSVSSSTDWKTFNGRSGPDIEVTVSGQDVVIPQGVFLAENVSFLPATGDSSMIFEYITKSSVNYQFTDMHVGIQRSSVSTLDSGSDVFIAAMLGLVLRNSELKVKGNDPLHLEVDYLNSDVVSIPSTLDTSVSVTEQFVTDDETIAHVIVDDNGISLGNDSENVSTRVIRKDGMYPEFNVWVTTPRMVTVSASFEAVMAVNLYASNGASLLFDKTWYHVNNSDVVRIHIGGGEKVSLVTDLLEMPPFTVIGSEQDYLIMVKQPAFTPRIAFFTFGAFLLAILLTCAILTIVGYQCLNAEVTRDISESSEEKPARKRTRAHTKHEKSFDEFSSGDMTEETNSVREYTRPIEESSS